MSENPKNLEILKYFQVYEKVIYCYSNKKSKLKTKFFATLKIL